MSLNSIITNVGAQIALQSLNLANSQLEATRKQISTGYRVADATDDGAAFAVAQSIRAKTGALATVNQQLGNAQGLVGVALTGLTNVSNSVNQADSLLTEIGNASNPTTQFNQYVASYKSLVTQVANTIDSSTYNGQTLLGTTGGAAGAASSAISNEAGASLTLHAEDASTIANALANLIGLTFTRVYTSGVATDTWTGTASQTAAATALSSTAATGTLAALQTTVANELNQAGADNVLISATISFNSAKIDSLNAGLGALIDADLAQESAQLQALQIRQQLGTQALSLANQAPQALLSLFK